MLFDKTLFPLERGITTTTKMMMVVGIAKRKSIAWFSIRLGIVAKLCPLRACTLKTKLIVFLINYLNFHFEWKIDAKKNWINTLFNIFSLLRVISVCKNWLWWVWLLWSLNTLNRTQTFFVSHALVLSNVTKSWISNWHFNFNCEKYI